MYERQYVLYREGFPIGWFAEKRHAQQALKDHVSNGFVKEQDIPF